MKILTRLVLATGYSRSGIGQAANPACHEASAESHPFADPSNLARTLCGAFPSPPGFERVKAADGSFADWLRHLPLRPIGTQPKTYLGETTVWKASEVAAVIDLDLIGKIQDCATSAVRLWVEYLVNHGKEKTLSVTMNQRKVLSWAGFMRGCLPSYNGETRKLSVTCGHRRPSVSTAQARAASIRKYVRHAMRWTNSSTLARHLRRATKAETGPGTVILQPGSSGGVGHASIIVDKAVNTDGDRLYLVANGFLPAQDMLIVAPGQSPADRRPWCTLDEFEASMIGLGSNYVYAVFD